MAATEPVALPLWDWFNHNDLPSTIKNREEPTGIFAVATNGNVDTFGFEGLDDETFAEITIAYSDTHFSRQIYKGFAYDSVDQVMISLGSGGQIDISGTDGNSISGLNWSDITIDASYDGIAYDSSLDVLIAWDKDTGVLQAFTTSYDPINDLYELSDSDSNNYDNFAIPESDSQDYQFSSIAYDDSAQSLLALGTDKKIYAIDSNNGGGAVSRFVGLAIDSNDYNRFAVGSSLVLVPEPNNYVWVVSFFVMIVWSINRRTRE